MTDIKSMTYRQFIQQLPEQEDQAVNAFIKWARKQEDLPDTQNIEKLARFLYRKLDRQQTLAFQKTVMIYFYVLNDFQQPDNEKDTLQEVNKIVELQNNDPEYEG